MGLRQAYTPIVRRNPLPTSIYRLINSYTNDINFYQVIPSISSDECVFESYNSGNISTFNNLHTLYLIISRALPPNIRILYCYSMHIPQLTIPLKILDVRNKETIYLPTLPSSLQYLICHDTKIQELPLLPTGLKFLDCHHTPITYLPVLPSGLITLDCHNCSLEMLPKLPLSIINLYCFPLDNPY